MAVSSSKGVAACGQSEKPWQSESAVERLQRQILRKMSVESLRDKYHYLMNSESWLLNIFVCVPTASTFFMSQPVWQSTQNSEKAKVLALKIRDELSCRPP